MLKRPKGEKCPAYVIGCAVTVAKIATGEIEEDLPGKFRQGSVGQGRGEGQGGKSDRRETAQNSQSGGKSKEGLGALLPRRQEVIHVK